MESNRRLTYTVEEAAAILGLGKTLTYNLVKIGKIPAIKCGGRWIIPVSRLRRLLDGEGGLG